MFIINVEHLKPTVEFKLITNRFLDILNELTTPYHETSLVVIFDFYFLHLSVYYNT